MGGCGGKQSVEVQQQAPNAAPVAPVKEESQITRTETNFKIELTKASPSENLGVTVAQPESGRAALLVKGVKEEGLIVIYNAAHAPDKQLLVGDHIIEVNGIAGDYDQMLQEITTVTFLTFTVSREFPQIDTDQVKPPVITNLKPDDDAAQHLTSTTLDFKIEITKASEDERLGVAIAQSDDERQVLCVQSLCEDGSIVHYNAAHAPYGLLVGDTITEVNEISGDCDKMIAEFTTAMKLTCAVVRKISQATDPPAAAPVVSSEPKSEEPEPATEQNAAIEVSGANSEVPAPAATESSSVKEMDVSAEDEHVQTDVKIPTTGTFDAGTEIVNVCPDESETAPFTTAPCVCCGRH